MNTTTNRNPEQDQPPEDTRTRIIIQARTAVLDDGDLPFGARALFCRLLDLSLSYYTQRADGVVVISATKLSEFLKCAPRTIYNWTKKLVLKRHVWMTEQRMPNMWPVNTYHIWQLDSPSEARQMPTHDGLWGNGVRRERPEPGQGARGYPVGRNFHTGSDSKSPVLPDNSHASGKEQHPSAANNSTSERQQTAPGSRKEQHVGAAKRGTSQPQKAAAPASKLFSGHRKAVADNKETQSLVRGFSDQKGSLPPEDFKVWEKKLKDWFPSVLEKRKAEFIKMQREVDQTDLATIADLSLRIEAIDRRLYGRTVPPKAAPKPPTKPSSPVQAKQPTEEEILEGAQYLVSLDKQHLLTKSQKAALAKAAKSGK